MQSRSVVRVCLVWAAIAPEIWGQTTKLDLRTQTRNVDFGAAPSTRPAKVGTVLPATCIVGDLFFKSDALVSQNLYGCTAVDTWTLLAGGSGVTPTAGFGIAVAGAGPTAEISINTADVPSRARVQSGQDVACVDTGSTDSYACAPLPAFTAYDAGGACTVSPGAVVEICTGTTLVFKANTANSEAATFAPNGLAAKTIQKNHDQALATGDIKAGQLVMVTYDQASDTWKMQSQSGAAGGGAGNHTLLSSTHTDTTGAGAEARGDLLRRGASSWERVTLGTLNRYLKSNGTDVVYSTNAAAGPGSCSGQFVRGVNADAAPTCEAIAAADLPAPSRKRTFGITIDGGGSAITTGVKGYTEVPFACTIDKIRLLADQSGSIVIDVWKDTYANYPPTDADSITASAPPTISSAVKAEDSTLSGWTTAVSAGDTVGFNVDSATTVTRVHLILECSL